MMRHLAQQEIQGAANDLKVAWFPGDLVGFDIHRCQQGVVVEHLLEVRYQPLAIHGVAGETAA